MKTIGTVTILFFGLAVHCYGAGDAVSSVTRDKSRETTTYQRDGKTILKIIMYNSTDPEHWLLVQQVIFHDEVVVDISNFRGKRAFLIHPKPHVTVGMQQVSVSGELESVGLMDDFSVPIELFVEKDTRLIPVSGKQLELNRALTKDVGGLLSPDNVKKSTSEDFGRRGAELVKKYHTDESAHQGGPSNDIPPPHDSSGSNKP